MSIRWNYGFNIRRNLPYGLIGRKHTWFVPIAAKIGVEIEFEYEIYKISKGKLAAGVILNVFYCYIWL